MNNLEFYKNLRKLYIHDLVVDLTEFLLILVLYIIVCITFCLNDRSIIEFVFFIIATFFMIIDSLLNCIEIINYIKHISWTNKQIKKIKGEE